jgi:ParB family chromosome partitioning protein
MTMSLTNQPKRPALGRGLSALIPPKPATSSAPSALPATGSSPGLLTLGIESIHPSKSQPRKTFPEEQLEELASSITEHGILQPVVVRRSGPGTYELVAGERRWRAAQRAGLRDVPAVLKDVASNEVLTLALVENLQRQDLNPIEEAEAFRHLVEDLSLTQEQVAQKVGKDRATIANALRLLKLPVGVRDAVVDGQLTMGHARALLSLADAEEGQPEEAMLRAAREVIAKNLSVRATEALVRSRKDPSSSSDNNPTEAPKSASQRDLEDRLRQRFGVRALVREKAGKGTLELHFHSLDELDELLRKLGL